MMIIMIITMTMAMIMIEDYDDNEDDHGDALTAGMAAAITPLS